jgi:hypothetical protein
MLQFMCANVEVRVGIDRGRQQVRERALAIGAPVLVSANTLWDNARRAFRSPRQFDGLDVALDSGGFVAMKRYGGYRWETRQYVDLAKRMDPAWWAQMDYCCEPEIAGNHAEVKARIERTVGHLRECRAIASDSGVQAPMPVLQGWRPEDYVNGPIYESGEAWPQLVGVGSVCRRNVNGPNGVMSVVEALDGAVPVGTRLHLFGVKTGALAELVREFPSRIASVDSMAWNVAYRWDSLKGKIARGESSKADSMANWYFAQRAILDSARQPAEGQLELSL